MSHITTVKGQYKSLAELRTAGERCGLVFMEGQTQHAWFGRFVGDSAEGRATVRERGLENLGKCDHALRLKDATGRDYEIGVVAKADGTYDLLYDSWGPGARLEAAAGKGLWKLRQEYAAAVTEARVERTMARQGFALHREEERTPDGRRRVRLRLRRR